MKKFKSKVSYGILIVIFLFFFAPIIIGIINNGITKNFFVLNEILIPIYAFILYLFLSTDYTIDKGKLKIKTGFVYNKYLDIEKIKLITETNNPISAPAASFDRIEIHYGEFSSVIISPKDKIGFIKELMKINPNIDSKILENQNET